jgi:epoxide hydrolase-like predicted phosphatase
MSRMSATPLRGLLVDWGGVLTVPLDGAMARWAAADGVDFEQFRSILRDWSRHEHEHDFPHEPELGFQQVSQDAAERAAPLVHRLERGELHAADFERQLADELSRCGTPVAADGLLARMLGDLGGLEDDMITLIRRARAAGIRTALLSNSWGDHYPDELWDDLFDAVVISGRVGMRKPEPAIFAHTAELLDLPAHECVMVDDLARNVHAAVAAGMVAVHHHDYEATALELEVLFGVPLRLGASARSDAPAGSGGAVA